MTPTPPRPSLEDVFKISGEPTYTFVEPEEFSRLRVSLRTPGRGLVIEGPSGIGKTTAVTKALRALEINDDVWRLNARIPDDREIIEQVPGLGDGIYVIDDFHRLADPIKAHIADYLKLLADQERAGVKIVVIGINRAGESLIHFARDLAGRVDVIRFESNKAERVQQLVAEGGRALNVSLPVAEIARQATGSFQLAQLICHSVCLFGGIENYQEEHVKLEKMMIATVRERVMDDLSMSFSEIAMKFAAGPAFSREGRAPYLHILRWLSSGTQWALSLDREMVKHPEMQPSVTAVISGGHLTTFLGKNPDLGDLLHFDPRTHIIAVEDPKFFFYIKNLSWSKFAERVGYLNIGFTTRYDFALSFAGQDRPLAKAIYEALVAREFSVFYDENEQARILAADLETYLAPIYQSEASFVLCLLTKDYPERIWTRFESRQFKARFGAESVIPLGIKGTASAVFDLAASVGGYYFRSDYPMEPQVEYLADLLKEKLADYRLQPRLDPGTFRCRHCQLVLSVTVLAPGTLVMCLDCAEKYRVR